MRVLCVIGTRPEAIKMAPVIKELKARSRLDCRVVATAQHRDMLDQVLTHFGVRPDVDLDLMRPGQTLGALTARLVEGMEKVLSTESPDAVLAQGDTTTVVASALASFYAGRPFGHIEAGLRSGDPASPFPEEMNRVLTARMAHWHFAPTRHAARALSAEGVPDARVFVTGNTVIDALLHTSALPGDAGLPEAPAGRQILVTLHRRENFGAPVRRICDALDLILMRNPDTSLLIPVHPNPNVRDVIATRFAGRPRATLTPPLCYRAFVAAMGRAHLILSDSGGVQEEAPALGKPVLVLRDTTERPEAVEAGATLLVGTRTQAIADAAQTLLSDEGAYRRMAQPVFPYGDGHAAARIADVLAAA